MAQRRLLVGQKNKRRIALRWLRVGLGLLISLGAFYLALREVALAQVWATLQTASFGLVLLALASVTLNNLAKALRWKVLVGGPGKAIAWPKYLGILLVGQLLNTIFPARLGDLARAYVLGSAGPGRSFVLGTVVLEKMLDSFAYLILVGSLLIWIPLPDWASQSLFAFTLVTGLIAGGIFLLVLWPRPFVRLLDFFLVRSPSLLQRWLRPRLERGLQSLQVIRQRRDLAWLVCWTALIWATAVLNNHLVLLALNMRQPVTVAMLLLVVLQAGISIPSAPGTLGLFEYLCVLVLGRFEIAPGLALGYGFLLHAVVFLPPLLGGLFAFWSLGLVRRRQNFQDVVV